MTNSFPSLRASGLGADVVVGDLEVVGGDGVDRDRGADVGHAVGVQAEGIPLGHAVDGNVVVAVVDARHRDRAVAGVDDLDAGIEAGDVVRSEEPTSELQSLMRSSYAVFCLK